MLFDRDVCSNNDRDVCSNIKLRGQMFTPTPPYVKPMGAYEKAHCIRDHADRVVQAGAAVVERDADGSVRKVFVPRSAFPATLQSAFDTFPALNKDGFTYFLDQIDRTTGKLLGGLRPAYDETHTSGSAVLVDADWDARLDGVKYQMVRSGTRHYDVLRPLSLEQEAVFQDNLVVMCTVNGDGTVVAAGGGLARFIVPLEALCGAMRDVVKDTPRPLPRCAEDTVEMVVPNETLEKWKASHRLAAGVVPQASTGAYYGVHPRQ